MKYTLISIFSLMVLASCDSKVSEGPSDAELTATSVSVLCEQRTAAAGIEDNSDAIIINSFQDQDLLYFSQMGNGDDKNPNFDNEADDASPYLYIYKYHENENAKWESGYNFSFIEERKPLDWETVKNIGSVSNAFSMYAFHFPIENKVRFKVEDDQTNQDNFKKSDILGAYHATSSLYTRLRFRLFHLMVYLKVTLYVPVYTDDNTYGDMDYSGFSENALQGAYVMDAYTDFGIEWRANRSSDTEAPLTKTAGNKKNITMYQHPSSLDNTMMIDVSKYYTQEVDGLCNCGDDCTSEICKKSENTKCGCDKVRVYNFSVLFPSQTFGNNFLCFVLTAPDDSKKYYYFSASQIVGDSGNYSLTQGTLQQLYLYLPRTTNETILVGANILPWSDARTDMTVTEEKAENNNN